LAAVEGNSDAVEILLEHGADIYVQDKDDKSVLYWAAAQNHQNVLKV
jgi:ankyrin repeat protein